MGVGNFREFRQRRASWLAEIADELVVSKVERVIDAQETEPALSTTEMALLSTATGLGHLLGLDDEDLAVDGLLTTEQVVGLISEVWRGGLVAGRWSAHLFETYQTLFVCGRDTGRVRSLILDALAGSQLHARLGEYLPRSDLSVIPSSFVDDICAAAVDAHPDSILAITKESTRDECRWHLPLLAWLLERLPEEAKRLFAPLEVRAVYPSGHGTVTGEDIDQWCRMKSIPLSMPGSWPARAGGDVPAWVREEVIEMGARFAHASTGNVPGWYFTSESDDEQRAFTAWTYNPGLFWDVMDSSIILGFILHFSDGDEAQVCYRYPVDDYVRLCDLKSLLAIGVIRVDHYTIDSDARLHHVQAFGIPLPPQLIAECQAALTEMTAGGEADLHLGLTETADVLEAMAIIDRNGLEGIEAFTQSQRDGAATEAESSYRRMLQLIDAATQDAVRGTRVDERLLSEARDELRVALARTDRRAAPLELAHLGPSRAYLQLRLHQEGLYLHCFVAYLDGERPVTHQLDFSSSIDLHSLPPDTEDCVSALTSGLSQLCTLRSGGVDKLVVRTSPALYGLPWHEALLRIGFSEVSFVHRLNSLAPSTPTVTTPIRALVRGFAGSGTTHLPMVTIELASVATLYEAAPLSETPPDVIHLSGHAVTGGLPYSVAIHDEPDHSLSSAGVLLGWRVAGTSVVVLSACSTGTVDVSLDQVLEVIPLDIAFVSAGASTVVSTCAPVNDTIAAAFACSFHYELASGGDVWNAYTRGRQLARGDDPDGPLAAWLDDRWPSWRDSLKLALARAPHDWQLFRLVGRHW